MTKTPLKLMVAALEPSANLHLEPILEKLGEVELSGIFDPKFGAPLIPSGEFSVMGFLDVIPKIKKAKEAIKKMAKMSERVDHVLLIDSPAFNLPLAKAIKQANPNVKITYYVLPQVWAWKEKRVEKVEKYCDNLASILPFESRWYNRSRYVGHPLLDEINVKKESLEESGEICYLPGSRRAEITKLMPIFRELIQKIPTKRHVLVIPPFFSNEKIREIYGDISHFDVSRNVHQAMTRAEFAFICSGTATLEAALVGVPFILAYKAKKLDYLIAKMFVKLEHVGLANLIMTFEGEEPLHEELLQEEVTVENLLKEYYEMDREYFFERASKLRKILQHGSAENVAKMISL